MASAILVISPEGVVRIHDAIICLSRFDEEIGWEISKDKLVLSALNSSKTASASISFYAKDFFQSFNVRLVDGTSAAPSTAFSYNVLAKALLSVFKGRMIDVRDRQTSVESCEITLQEGPQRTESRMVVKMICRHGVKKTYKLTYEVAPTMRAIFNQDSARNGWKISASILRAFSEYFEIRTNHLDFFYESGRFLVTSYTEKIKNGSEVLRQPLQTTVAIDRLDFDEFNVEEKVHIGISVKDFRAIITHAESLRATITAKYSVPKQPLQFSYQEHGMLCEFTLVTIGEFRGGSVTPAPAPAVVHPADRPSARPESRNPSNAARSQTTNNSMPPPVQPASRSFTREPENRGASRPSPLPPQASINQDSLFLQDDDEEEEERRWGERSYDKNEDEDELTWEQGDMAPRGSIAQGLKPDASVRAGKEAEEVPPTQRMSQVRGLFDFD